MSKNLIATIVRELNKIVIIPGDAVSLSNGEGYSVSEGYFYFRVKPAIDLAKKKPSGNKVEAFEIAEAKMITINPSPEIKMSIKFTADLNDFPGENYLEFLNGSDNILLEYNSEHTKAKLSYGPGLSDSKLKEGIADFENYVVKDIDFVENRIDCKQVEIKNFFNVYRGNNLSNKIAPIDAEEIDSDVIYEVEENLSGD